MQNQLPTKLLTLRKIYGYSQGDLAEKLDVPFTEYIKWENGSLLPTIEQIRQLSKIFNVKMDVFIQNTLPLPEIEIPSVALDLEKTQQIEKTVELDTVPVQPLSDTIQTPSVKEVPASHFEPKPQAKKKKGWMKWLLGGSALLVVLIVGLIVAFFLPKNNTFSVNLSTINRLAVADSFTLYINKDKNVQKTGIFNSPNFDHLVQVSARGTHAVGLKEDGTVVTNGNEAVSDWTNITMIAAGNGHTVGLKKDGTVVCAGSDNACDVSGWKTITAIYAGKDSTVGIQANGTMVVSGQFTEMNQTSDVKKVAMSDTQLFILKKDGTVASFGEPTVDTSSWQNITDITASSNIVAGLTKGSTVNIVANQEEVMKEVSQWSNIRFLAANNNTLIAVDKNDVMFGAGDNTLNLYPIVEKQQEVKQLESVQGIEITPTTVNVSIKWKDVPNAQRYKITINTNPKIEEENIVSPTYSVPTSQFEEGKQYSITITAIGNEEEYKASVPAIISYTYTPNKVAIAAPQNLNAAYTPNGWQVTWDQSENADVYAISLDGKLIDDQVKDTTYKFTDIKLNSKHTISVVAKNSENPNYTDSEAAQGEFTYSDHIQLKITFVGPDGKPALDKTGKPIEQMVIESVKIESTTIGGLLKDISFENYKIANPTTEISWEEIASDELEIKLEKAGS